MRHSIRSHPADDLRGSHRSSRPAALPRGEGLTKEPERAVLVCVLLPNTRTDLSDPLGEVAALAGAAGVQVVDSLIQKRTSMAPAYALGKGKLADLGERIREARANIVIFDNDLTPRQIRGLEETVGCKVIDRSELILDIFASHAKTHEAQLQVELAQLEYTSPRIRGMWRHLERIAGGGGGTAAGSVGGVGTRGPGERQIELDRRIVKDRISHLRHEIANILHRKQREVRTRHDQFTISLVGYTNSGKSTLMNRLTGAGQFVADQPFATLDTKTIRWELGDGRASLLSDTVGFIRDLPHHLIASFRATLEEAIHAHLLLHVVDISSRTAWQQIEAVDQVLAGLGCDSIPQITLLNKIDITDKTSMAEALMCHRPGALRLSAITGEGIDRLTAAVIEQMRRNSVDVTLFVPHREGKLLNELVRLADIRERRYQADGVELDLCIDRAQLSQLQGRYGTFRVIETRPQPAGGDGDVRSP